MAQFINFGNGHDGSPAVSGTINTYATCTGTAAASSLTTTLSASAGDQILIHQTYGTGAGQWEVNYVIADAGATLTLAYPLAYSYVTGAQAVLIPQYTGGTLSGTVTCTAWAGSTGGIIALMSSGSLTISGTLNVNGQGFRGSPKYASGIGGQDLSNVWGYKAEGTGGAIARGTSNAANGNGAGSGGAGYDGNHFSSGSGGSNASGATQGGTYGGPAGAVGSQVGNAALTNMCFGGGGGGGVNHNTSTGSANGSNGGGIILIIAKTITVTNSISALGTGAVEGTDGKGSGGAGAGGSILIKTRNAVLGTSKLTATGGASISHDQYQGGAGGAGRIRVDYYSGVTGTTSPTLSSAQDTSLTSQVYTGMI